MQTSLEFDKTLSTFPIEFRRFGHVQRMERFNIRRLKAKMVHALIQAATNPLTIETILFKKGPYRQKQRHYLEPFNFPVRLLTAYKFATALTNFHYDHESISTIEFYR